MDTGIIDIGYKEEDIPDELVDFLRTLSKFPSNTLSKQEKMINIITSHDLYKNGKLIGKEQFNLRNESMGTQKLFQILGPYLIL